MKFIGIGTFFGFVLVKSEVISWFRIQEMFLFDDIHMYGIFALAILTGIISIQIIKKFNIKDIAGNPIAIKDKDNAVTTRYIAGGIIFGMGWAFTGACPGPLYALVGSGIFIYIIPLLAAVAGAALYGVVQKHLPH